MLALLHSDLEGPVNIGNPHEVSVLHLAETIRALTGSSSEIVFIDRPVDDPTVRQPDITLARTRLGWEPEVGFEEGLGRTLAWFAGHPDLLGAGARGSACAATARGSARPGPAPGRRRRGSTAGRSAATGSRSRCSWSGRRAGPAGR